MPYVSRLFIKSGLIYFLLALISGLLLEIEISISAVLRPLFWHMLMLGWITQIIMGVSHWMFPGRSREEGFKAHTFIWLAFWLLNIGLPIRIIAEPLIAYSNHFIWKILLVLSAILQLLAVGFYVAEIWPRVVSKKELIRRRKARRKS